MAISTGVPETWHLPLFWANVDGSMAGNLTQQQPALLIGQMLATGSATADVPVAVGSPEQGTALFGAGSMLDRMIQAWFAVNTTQLLYAIPVADAIAGVKANGTIVVAGPATASGTLSIYIAGQLTQTLVGSTDASTAIATALAATINGMAQLPVTATVVSSTVTLTCKWKGLTGNDITILPNYRGAANGEALPTGVTLTVTAMASGTTAPTFTNAIAAIQTQQIRYGAMPYTDAATQTVWANEFGFGSGGRWNYTRQKYGFVCNAYRGDYATALSWGASQNQPVLSTLFVEPGAPTPVWEWAAQYAGLAALAFTDDPARPLQTLELLTCLPAPIQSRFSQAELNNLGNSGFAVQAVAPDGNPMILAENTQYQLNSYGQGDTAFRLLTVLATLAELLSRMKSAITSKYPRVKLIPDGTRIGPGQAAVTPGDIKAELISEFLQAQYDGLVADTADFIKNLVVEIDDTNPNRVNVLWPPQLAGQLRVFSALAQFRLLYPTVSLT